MNSVTQQLEFLARTSQDPVDAQGLRMAVEALEFCKRTIDHYACNCALPCTEEQYKEGRCGLRAKRTLKALEDGRTDNFS